MRKILLLLLALTLWACTDKERDRIGSTEVTIETEKGRIVLRLYDDTPTYRDNFIKLIKEGAYDGTVWHRIVKDGLIQAGSIDEDRWKYTLPAEIHYPRHFHKAGALAAAREGDDVNPEKRSSGTQFYIVTGKVFSSGSLAELHQMMQDADTLRKIPAFTDLQKKVYTTKGGTPHLDGEYTVFGEVVEGLETAKMIGRNRTDEKEHPLKKLVIKRITVK